MSMDKLLLTSKCGSIRTHLEDSMWGRLSIWIIHSAFHDFGELLQKLALIIARAPFTQRLVDTYARSMRGIWKRGE